MCDEYSGNKLPIEKIPDRDLLADNQLDVGIVSIPQSSKRSAWGIDMRFQDTDTHTTTTISYFQQYVALPTAHLSHTTIGH
jgi:hypothetical protein